MTSEESDHFTLWPTVAIAALVSITAVAGLFWSPTYARETPRWAVEAIGGDAVNLLLVVPVLLTSGISAYRGSARGRLVWLGAQGYLLYNFVIYTLGVHFNALFLVYCATLSLCFYATVWSLPLLPVEEIARLYGSHAPRKSVTLVFFALATSEAFGWLKEDLPAIFGRRVPESLTQTGLPTNPVHVLDLSFLLPALFITAVLLWRQKTVADAVAPPLLILLALISMEIAAIGVAMARKGFESSPVMAGFFALLGFGFAALAWRCLQR